MGLAAALASTEHGAEGFARVLLERLEHEEHTLVSTLCLIGAES